MGVGYKSEEDAPLAFWEFTVWNGGLQALFALRKVEHVLPTIARLLQMRCALRY